MAIYLSEGMIARSFWQELHSSVVDKEALEDADAILTYTRSLEASYPNRTGSISLHSIKTLWLLANYFAPKVIVEVGTYIGRSTLAMYRGAQVSLQALYTCDYSFDCWQPPHEEAREVIHYFGKTSSTHLLQGLHGQTKVDMFLLDGRLQPNDLELIAGLRHPKSVFLVDDFEGVEKGVDNVLKLRAAFPDLMLLAPPAVLSEGWTTSHCIAVLAPTSMLEVSRQQRLPLWMM